MRKSMLSLGYLVAIAGISLAGPAQAVTATGSLGVTITITNECTVGASTPVDFGSHGLLSADVDAAGALSVTCTSGAGYTVALGTGSGSGANTTLRKMTGPASATVTYRLFRDSFRTLNWGNTVGTDLFSGSGTGTAQPIPVYGRVVSQITPAAGVYNDTVTVTVEY